MRAIRLLKTPTVLFALAFSFASLGVLPTALCCQAVVDLSADGPDGQQCPHRGADGEACPLHQPKPTTPESGCFSLSACPNTQTLLASLVTLTGAMPEPRFELASGTQAGGLGADRPVGPLVVGDPPDAPPPRS